MQEAQRDSRSLAMDVTRAWACAMVVLVHTAAVPFYAFGPLWLPSVVYDSLSRAAVPIFFMLSGALLLWKDEPVLPFYRKRLPRIAIPLIFWTIVYVSLFGDRSMSLGQQVTHYLMGPYQHLWYLYAALGLYLSAPYLGKMLRASTDTELKVFFVLWFVVGCVLNQVRLLFAEAWDPSSFYGAQLFSGFIGYVVLGAYLWRRLSVVSHRVRWLGALVFLVSSGLIAWATCLYSAHVGEPNEFFFSYLTPLVAISAVAAFVFFRSVTHLPRAFTVLVRWISDSSLGIYCVHPMFLWLYVQRLHGMDVLPVGWLTLPILWFAVFASTAVVVHGARYMPFVRRVM